MDRDRLEAWLDEGLSLDRIGELTGRHPSTVSYWLKKHRLVANGHAKHTSRGPLARAELERLVEAGLSIRQIAEQVERSAATVRYWLAHHGLKTDRTRRREIYDSVRGSDASQVNLACPVHGLTRFRRRVDGGFRCSRCDAQAVSNHRRRAKRTLVDEAGGCCAVCGYDRHVAALQFHHLDPAEKAFALSARGATISLARLRIEAGKCVVLCANCHAEVEAGAASLSK
jgi:Helix-turn-helix domain